MHILVLAPPAAPLGHGAAGGITTHISQTLKALRHLGHQVQVIAPHGSHLEGCTLIPIQGALQPSAAGEPCDAHSIYPVPPTSVLAAMWREALSLQAQYDLILNFAQDWLPYYLTEFFHTPVAHIANMGAVNATTCAEMARVSRIFPGRVAVLSEAQAADLKDVRTPFLLSIGFDFAAYPFCAQPTGGLIWAGRISKEKGLEDALKIAAQTGASLSIAGAVDDETYWQRLRQEYSDQIDYRGFLVGQELMAFLGSGRVLFQTQKWSEAFGIVTVESLACGTPVIAYDRGANGELVADGLTGFLVPADKWALAAEKVAHLDKISRAACRAHAEDRFSLLTYAARLKTWLEICV